jgi:radical SAM protein with 4Fe4S-binding SPASM domain
MIVRYEPWGVWVKLERAEGIAEGAVVALDRGGARALGLDGGEAWEKAAEGPSTPIEVHMAVTARCAHGCEGCYTGAHPDGEEPPLSAITERLDMLAAARVFTVAFGGGEPTTRVDLGDLARAAKERGLAPVVTTSGLGLNAAKIENLREFAQVNVSYDGVGTDYARVRGFDGARGAERAIAQLAAAGVRVGVNVVLTRATFDAVPSTVAHARALGASEAQLLRYKPAGRAASLDYLARRLTPAQSAGLGPLIRRLATAHPDLRIRIDCALVPFLSADPELANDPERLERWGVFGCEAAGALAAVRVDGRSAPCSFAGAADDAELARWRAYTEVPPEPCASCTLRSVCKGGCRVVADFVLGGHRPDPECPRVRAARASA